jgi:hypothetical protein
MSALVKFEIEFSSVVVPIVGVTLAAMVAALGKVLAVADALVSLDFEHEANTTVRAKAQNAF